MFRSKPHPLRRLFVAAGSCFLLSLAAWAPLQGQELPLKREIPRPGTVSCPQIPTPRPPGDEERAQASRLASSADQALILGDQARARDLLARAVELDPSSGEMAYRYARVLEDLGERAPATEQFCRALALGPGQEEAQDARDRIEALAALDRPSIPETSIASFQAGLSDADAGRLERAEQAFSAAAREAPDWAAPLFNRGVVRSRMGNVDAAVADLQRYLAMVPDASDAMLVSQRIGQLQITAPLPKPGAAFGLGLLMPGLGQFYSGRTLGGLTVVALAGGAAGAGILIKEETVRCVGSVPGGDCPPERIIGQTSDRPYMIPGLAVAAAVSFIGAVEAYVRARRQWNGRAEEGGGLEIGTLSVRGPGLSARGRTLDLNVIRVRF